MKITTITLSVYEYWATCWIHRGAKCKMYNNITQSSVKRITTALAKVRIQ